MRRFMKALGELSEDVAAPAAAEDPAGLPCIVEAVEKLAAEMDDAQDILGNLKDACEREAAAAPVGAAGAPEPPPLRAGQRVVVSGLQSSPEHNGKLGTVDSYRCVSSPESLSPARAVDCAHRLTNRVALLAARPAAAGLCAWTKMAARWRCDARG